MYDEGDVFPQAQGVEPGVEIARVIDEAVGGVPGLARTAHTHQVGSQATPAPLDMGNDIAPEVRGGGIAVQEDHRLTTSGIDVRHVRIEYRHAPTPVGVGS